MTAEEDTGRTGGEQARLAAERAVRTVDPSSEHRRRRQADRGAGALHRFVRRQTRPLRHRIRRKHRVWKLSGLVLVVVVAALAASAAAAALLSKSSLSKGVAELSKAITAVHQGDRATAVRELDLASASFAEARSTLTAWWTDPAAFAPGVSEQLRALRSVAGAGVKVTSAGLELNQILTAEKQLPYGPPLISMLRRLDSTLKSAGASLDSAEAELSGARSSLLLPPISTRLDEAVTKVSAAAHEDHVAVAGVAAAVEFLGGGGPRSYFLAVQTEAESHASGGVIGNYGIITADDGILHLTRFGTTSPLQTAGDVATRKLIAPADYVARYAQFDPSTRWANVSMSPDFPTVAKVIEGLYPQEGGFPVDGVISVDPFGLADLLRATGPLEVGAWPQPITAANAVTILLHSQYDTLTGAKRANFLGEVTEMVWHRFVDGPLPDLAALIRDLTPAFADKNLLLASTSPATEGLFRQLGVAGSFPVPANSDLLALTTQNSGENKIDWYLRRSIVYDVSYAPNTGAVSATVKISLHNLAPTKGQSAYVIGSAGQNTGTPGENHCYLTIYTPWLFTRATVNGRSLPLNSSRELGVWADSAFIDIPSGGTTTIVVSLEGHLRPDSPYRLTMSRQPMVEPDLVQVGVRLPAGEGFDDPSPGVSLADGGRELTSRLDLMSNRSISASLAR